MSDIAIKFENISKQYRLGSIGTGTLSHDLNRWWNMNIRGKEDPYLKIGETNQRDTKGTSDYVWALRDINLEVKKGEVLGIIGKNGAGKSTLLKILSRVTKPTTGKITYKGRIASLLEVGTGFHLEMTGRENIYMNGTIMGMTRSEISRKLDEIVDFAGIERYIDTPTKRYSSGMTVRLGFAIAAHLEPEILVVDEVLAVGDAEFQKKAIGKMQDVSAQDGRTVLFVSHNLQAIRNLCPTSLLLHQGEKIILDRTDIVLSKYSDLSKIHKIDANTGKFSDLRRGDGAIRFTNIDVLDDKNNSKFDFKMGDTIKFILTYKVFVELDGLKVAIALRSGLTRETVTSFEHILSEKRIPTGSEGSVELELTNIYIRPGEYPLYFHISNQHSAEITMDVVDDLTAPLTIYAGEMNEF
jgi:lipopolysaccharide transport system ATP-binding protein